MASTGLSITASIAPSRSRRGRFCVSSLMPNTTRRVRPVACSAAATSGGPTEYCRRGEPSVGPTRRPANGAITGTAATASIRGRGQFQFCRQFAVWLVRVPKRNSSEHRSRRHVEGKKSLSVTATRRQGSRHGRHREIPKHRGCSHAGKTGAVMSVAPANNPADSVAAKAGTDCHAIATQSVATDSSNKFTDSL